jgi:hypothetical protein
MQTVLLGLVACNIHQIPRRILLKLLLGVVYMKGKEYAEQCVSAAISLCLKLLYFKLSAFLGSSWFYSYSALTEILYLM